MGVRVEGVRFGGRLGKGGRLVGVSVRWDVDVSQYRPPYCWPVVGFFARAYAMHKRQHS